MFLWQCSYTPTLSGCYVFSRPSGTKHAPSGNVIVFRPWFHIQLYSLIGLLTARFISLWLCHLPTIPLLAGSSKASKLYNQHLDPSPFFQTPVMPYRFRPLERLVLAAIDMRVSPRKSNPWQLDIHAYSSVITRLFTHVDKELFNRIFQCTEGQAIQLSIRLSGNQHHARK